MGFNGTAGSRSPTGRVVQASAAMVFGYHASRHCRLACLYFVVTSRSSNMDTCYFLCDQYNDNYMYSITVYNNYTIYTCIMYVGVCACVWMRACVRACVCT